MRTVTLTITLAIGWLMANTTDATEAIKVPAACCEVQACGSPDCCGHCGCHCGCEKYCKLVCEMKEVKKTVWVVHCSDFCAPLPGCGRDCCGCGKCEACKAGKPCETEPACCDGSGKNCDPCASEKNKCLVPPKCGKVRGKKTLEKKEVVCKAPSYKCVVVYCCPNCGAQQCGAEKAPAPVSPPTAPAPGKTTQDAPLPPTLGELTAK